MEHDSFEHEEVAQALKGRFIAIKVDREERPDVDAIYMDAVVGLTGHGGWPMSVFLTPELKPFWGGTYFPRAHFLKVLDALSGAWRDDRARVGETAKQITNALNERNQRHFEGLVDGSVFDKAADALSENFDSEFGGFSAAPKFPPSEQCRFLMRHGWREKRPELIEMATTTLEAMARGGIYDHLGGGFSRYSVDKYWLVPHFEKMLYDNALLVPAYLEAFQLTKKQLFADIASETLNYVLRDMTSEHGGFYAAEDAGEVGREGEYYVWRFDQLSELLDKSELEAISANTLVTPAGNFEHSANVLAFKPEIDWSVRSGETFVNAFKKLRQARLIRQRPRLDNKIITSWNGFFISALSAAARVLGDSRYSDAAIRAMKFIRQSLYKDGELWRTYSDGVAANQACLEDYAALIDAALSLYQVTAEQETLLFAQELQVQQDKFFWVPERALYRYSKASELPVEQFDRIDGATPSGNSITLKNLAVLELLSPQSSCAERRRALSAGMAGVLANYPQAVCRALEGFLFDIAEPLIIAMPKQSPQLASELGMIIADRFTTPLVITWVDSSQAHICHGSVCSAPTTDLGLLVEAIDLVQSNS